MILTCPACDTKYVVKDGAIPPGGRQVRCASCRHSWHQDPEEGAASEVSEAGIEAQDPDLGHEPSPVSEAEDSGQTDWPIAGEAASDTMSPAEDRSETVTSSWSPPTMEAAPIASEPPYGTPEPAPEPSVAFPGSERSETIAQDAAEPVAQDPEPSQPQPEPEEEFAQYSPIAGDDQPSPRRWPRILGLLVLIVAAAAAFWFFAPPEWKQRAGIAAAGATPLQLMITTSDRQPLASGNELVAISGRVINPTDKEQNVPPIRAELRDKQSKAVIHRWTIPPPTPSLAPRSSASFNSAEVDVPKGGDELTVTLGGAA